jgi:predicted ATP-grasp superfamily ATP-dependent carboligase
MPKSNFSLINMHAVVTQTKIVKHYLGAILEWLEVTGVKQVINIQKISFAGETSTLK